MADIKSISFSQAIDQALFNKKLPTKTTCRGIIDCSDLEDLRGIGRARNEMAREYFNIATGKDFDKNIHQEGKQNKQELMAKSAKYFYAYELYSKFLLDPAFVTEFDKYIAKTEGDAYRGIFKDLTSKFIGKIQEIILRRAQQTKQILEGKNPLDLNLAEYKDQFKNILNSCKIFLESMSTKIKFNGAVAKFHNIIKSFCLDIEIDSDFIDFFAAREAIKNDPEFQYKIVTFSYRMLYDPIGCYNLVESMGFAGRALLACLGTRSNFFAKSRKHLPDSAFIFYKMLGLEKENLRIIERMGPEKIDKAKSYVIKLSTVGSLLYQEMEAFAHHNYSPKAAKNLLVSCFGQTEPGLFTGYKRVKNGYINSVWQEIEANFDGEAIDSYLKDVFKYKRGLNSEAIGPFTKAIGDLAKYQSIERHESSQKPDFFETTYRSKINRLSEFLSNEKIALSLQSSDLLERFSESQNKINYFN